MSLPVEIWESIFLLANKEDISALLFVSKDFHEIAKSKHLLYLLLNHGRIFFSWDLYWKRKEDMREIFKELCPLPKPKVSTKVDCGHNICKSRGFCIYIKGIARERVHDADYDFMPYVDVYVEAIINNGFPIQE